MSGPTSRILILGGTSEAAELARTLQSRGFEVLVSFKGLTTGLHDLPFPVRTGGFGGPTGLADELRAGGHTLLVDATHPFAARMAANAAIAAADAVVPCLRLLRPPWHPEPGDRWIDVVDLDEAAATTTRLQPGRVLLSVGREGAAAFVGVEGVEMVLRTLTPTAESPTPGARLIVGRGPFSVEDEMRTFTEHAIDALVTRNSGGRATAAKLVAARRLGLPVVMIRRPPPPDGESAGTVDGALTWIGRHVDRP